jgi:hypothetical protein
MNESKLIKNQTKTFRKDFLNGVLVVNVRYDDQCNNGHNTFSITADLYDRGFIRGETSIVHSNGKKYYLGSCGCLHDEVKKHFPDLSRAIDFHLCSSDGPLYYIENSLYHFENNDINGIQSCSIWPEFSAIDFEYYYNQDEFKTKLQERLPSLMEEFYQIVTSFGFQY